MCIRQGNLSSFGMPSFPSNRIKVVVSIVLLVSSLSLSLLLLLLSWSLSCICLVFGFKALGIVYKDYTWLTISTLYRISTYIDTDQLSTYIAQCIVLLLLALSNVNNWILPVILTSFRVERTISAIATLVYFPQILGKLIRILQ